MKVKFTNGAKAIQNIYAEGQLVACLLPGESYITDDEDLIEKLQAQTDMDAEEVTAEEAEAAAAAKPAANQRKKR